MARCGTIAQRTRAGGAAVLALAALAGSAPAAAAERGPAAGPPLRLSAADWRSYLDGPAHTSDNHADRAITASDARMLQLAWHFTGDRARLPGQPGPGYLASPTVAGGAVYIGSQTGWFYKLNARTGAVLRKIFLGYQPRRTCSPLGIVATAAVGTDPSDHRATVYVAAPDGLLYALTAATLSVRWKSVIAVPSRARNDYFQWSSPTVAHRKIYVGIASNCDKPLVRGGVAGYDQATGRRFAVFYPVPRGSTGGSVWSSVAVDRRGNVYAATGNGAAGARRRYWTESIVKLDGRTLAPLGSFQVPTPEQTRDGDFGASPTIFGRLVGACNKNGIFYALHRSTMRLAWEQRVGGRSGTGHAECIAAAAYDGRSLYLGGPATRVHHRWHRGSIASIDPRTGRFRWRRGLPNGVQGSPAMNGGGVITVGTFDRSRRPNAEYLVSAANGTILRTLQAGSAYFAQAVFAGGWLFTANWTGVYGWRLRS